MVRRGGPRFIVQILHLMNVSLCNEFVEQRVPLLIGHFILDCHKHVLQILYRVVQLHGAFGHVCLLPGSLNQLLLPLDFGLGDVLS